MRVHVENHGCRLNQADGDGLEVLLARAGHRVERDAAGADIVVVNTCSITHRAGADARQRVRALARAGHRVVVTGCHANADAEALGALDGVIAVLGNEHKAEIASVLGVDRNAPAPQLIAASSLLRRRAAPDLPINPRPSRARAYLKVQDGCNYRCSFCIVPTVRGRSRSIELSEVSSRARALADAGVPEIVLTGVHLGTYGWDIRLRPGLVPLVEAVLAAAPNARIRLGSIDPHEVPVALLELMRDEPRICRHLHLPIQSGDDEVLQRMRRAHRVAHLRELIPRIRAHVSDVAVGSDIIVGHPGETRDAFERTVALAADTLDYAHVFTFSPRPGTEAADMDDAVEPGERQRRNGILRRRMDENWLHFRDRLVGRTTEVVVHRRRHAKTDRLLGTTTHGVRVACDLPGAAGDRLLGHRVQVRVDAVDGDTTLATALV